MSDFYPDGKKITVGKEEFTIMPLVLRKRTEILRIIADIFIGVSRDMPGLTKDQILKDKEMQNTLFLKMINSAGEKLVDLYEKILGKDREWLLDNVRVKDEVEILVAFWEVNDIPFLFGQVKSLIKGMEKQK